MAKINKPTVSVVIPVYNVAGYVEKCVRSVMNQTITNIEIITINDGSTDKSSDILAELARDDSRIILVTQKNAGVSSARNTGIDIARGEYIVFVDADDWLAEEYVEYMIKVIDETKSEMAISVSNFTTRDIQQVTHDEIGVWSVSKAVAKFLYPGMPIGSWNKIYRHDFLKKNKLRFQEDMFMGEGMRFITDAAQRASRIGVGRRKVYWYRLNNASSATTVPSVKHGVAAMNAIKSIEDNLLIKNKQVLRAVAYHKWMNTFYMLRILIINRVSRMSYSDLFYRCMHDLRVDGFSVILHSDVPISLRLRMMGILLFPTTTARLINAQKARSLKRDRMA